MEKVREKGVMSLVRSREGMQRIKCPVWASVLRLEIEGIYPLDFGSSQCFLVIPEMMQNDAK
jgi:hypothetical protein